MQRSDGPALRDTLLWFALLLASGAAGYALWGSWLAIIPFAIYGVLYGSASDCAGTNAATAQPSGRAG